MSAPSSTAADPPSCALIVAHEEPPFVQARPALREVYAWAASTHADQRREVDHPAIEPYAEPALRRRLQHYEDSLTTLREVASDLPMADQLAFELWALRTLPPD